MIVTVRTIYRSRRWASLAGLLPLVLSTYALLAAPEDDVKGEQPEEADTCGDVALTTEPGGAAEATLAKPLQFVLPEALQVTSGEVSPNTVAEFSFCASQPPGLGPCVEEICQYGVREQHHEVPDDELGLSGCTKWVQANSEFTAEAMRLSVVSFDDAERSNVVARIRLPRAECTPSVPVVPPIASAPPGSGEFDEEAFLQTPLPVTTDNVKQIDHPQSGFNVVPNEETASSNTRSAPSLGAAASSGFESVHPVAVTAFENRIFVFGVASNGRVMFQIFGYRQRSGLWLSGWEEVPGGCALTRA